MQTRFCRPALEFVNDPAHPFNPAHFDQHQFVKPHARPVRADTGIAWSDFQNMNIRTHKPSNERRLATPLWALNDNKLREVLVNYFETRAQITVRVGTLKERLDRAQTRLMGQRKELGMRLDGLCLEYTRRKRGLKPDADRLRTLREEIENLDTRLRFLEPGPGVVLRMVHLYHRGRHDSVATALAIGCKPPQVRTTLFRMASEWENMKRRVNKLPAMRPTIGPRARIDLTGKRVGNLVVLGPAPRPRRWVCLCDCGNKTIACTSHLNAGSATSCGCSRKRQRNRHQPNPLIDMTGQRVGCLVVLGRSNARSKTTHSALWTCKCDCGNVMAALGISLRRGTVRSCGCLKRKAVRQQAGLPAFRVLHGQL